MCLPGSLTDANKLDLGIHCHGMSIVTKAYLNMICATIDVEVKDNGK